MGNKEWSPSSVFELLGDKLARRILVSASEQPLAADDFVERLDVSRPTVYRRVNALLEYDFLAAQQQIDADGNHYKTFETTLEHLTFEIENGESSVDIQMKQSLVDQFDALWTDLEQSSADGNLSAPDRSDRADHSEDVHHG